MPSLVLQFHCGTSNLGPVHSRYKTVTRWKIKYTIFQWQDRTLFYRGIMTWVWRCYTCWGSDARPPSCRVCVTRTSRPTSERTWTRLLSRWNLLFPLLVRYGVIWYLEYILYSTTVLLDNVVLGMPTHLKICIDWELRVSKIGSKFPIRYVSIWFIWNFKLP